MVRNSFYALMLVSFVFFLGYILTNFSLNPNLPLQSEVGAQSNSCDPLVVFPPYESGSCTHIVGAGEQYQDVTAALRAIGSNGAGKVVCVRDNKEYIGITRINSSGEPGNPLVIKSHPTNTTKPKFVDPRPYLNADTQWSSPIDVFGKNVVIDGLESARSAGRGIRVANTENVLLKNVVAHDSYGVAVAVLTSKNVVVDGCNIYRDRYQGSLQCTGSCRGPGVGESMVVADSENVLVQNCVVRDQLNKHGGGGTYATLRSENVVYRNNEQYSDFVGPSLHPDNARNVVYENNLIAAVCGHVGGGSGFYQYDEVYRQTPSQDAYNTTVRNNLLIGMSSGLRLGGCEVTSAPGGGLGRVGPCRSIDQVVENNTVIASRNHGFMINMGRKTADPGYTEVSGLRVANNIFYGKEQSGVGGWQYPGASPGSQFFSGNVWSKVPLFGLPPGDVVADNLAGVFENNANPTACVTEAEVKNFVATGAYAGKGADVSKVGNQIGLDYTILAGCGSSSSPPKKPTWNYTLQDLVRIFEDDSSQTIVRNWGSSRKIPVSRESTPQAIYCGDDNQPSNTPVLDDERIYTAIGCVPISTAQSFTLFVLERTLGVGGGVTFLLIIYAAYKVMISNGDPKKLQAGRELLTAAISGLLLIIFSSLIIRIIGSDILRIPGL